MEDPRYNNLKKLREEAANKIREINDRTDLLRKDKEELAKSYDEWMEVLETTLEFMEKANEEGGIIMNITAENAAVISKINEITIEKIEDKIKKDAMRGKYNCLVTVPGVVYDNIVEELKEAGYKYSSNDKSEYTGAVDIMIRWDHIVIKEE